MHRIIKTHLDKFSIDFGFVSANESSQFEAFANYVLVFPRTGGEFDIADITTTDADDGIDGLAIIINEEVIISKEDATDIFNTPKKNHDVELVFIQSKRSESFELSGFLPFKESVLRFLTSETYAVNDEVQKNMREIFDECLKNVPKIRNGKPNITVKYATTGNYQQPTALETAKEDFKKQLEDLGYFATIEVDFIGRDELTKLWVGTYTGIEAQLPIFSNAPLPQISGIEEAYLVVAKAKDVVTNLLCNSDGNLRTQVFEENVRSFLGVDNPVNISIAATLSNEISSSRFPVLNNGITIVSPDVRVQGNTVHLVNYQIVNGCQTSNVLYESRDKLNDSIMVNLKIVETDNEDVFSELVRATNSQSKVEEYQFFSLKPFAKKIEEYFDTFEGSDGRIFFERRERQFVGRDVPHIRIFSVHMAAKCVAAMFLHRPDLAYRYPKRVLSSLGDKIFNDTNKEVFFYSACLVLYRIHILVSNGTLPQNIKKYKWHMLTLVKCMLIGNDIPELNSKKSEKSCHEIINTFSKSSDKATELLKKSLDIITSIDDLTDDRLKRQLILDEMIFKI